MVGSKKSFQSFIINNALILVLLILFVITAVYNIKFIFPSNLKNIGINTSVRFLIALGVSGCLITKGTDLSAGRLVGLGACIAGTLLQKPDAAGKFFPNLGAQNVLLVLLLTVAICSVFGMLNGFIISVFKVPPFITTLGMQTVVYGLCLVYTKATPLGGYLDSYSSIAKSTIAIAPVLVVIAVVVGSLMWFLYNKTTHGKSMYAVGGNETAAEVSGINVKRTTIIIYALAAVLYALAGFLLGAKAGGASVNTGQGYELEAIASCTIGGVSTNGGVGRVTGILVGVLVFEILKSSLQFLQVDPAYQFVVQGIVIIVAVALDLRKYLEKR